jgi:hypothetical protein
VNSGPAGRHLRPIVLPAAAGAATAGALLHGLPPGRLTHNGGWTGPGTQSSVGAPPRAPTPPAIFSPATRYLTHWVPRPRSAGASARDGVAEHRSPATRRLTRQHTTRGRSRARTVRPNRGRGPLDRREPSGGNHPEIAEAGLGAILAPRPRVRHKRVRRSTERRKLGCIGTRRRRPGRLDERLAPRAVIGPPEIDSAIAPVRSNVRTCVAAGTPSSACALSQSRRGQRRRARLSRWPSTS